MNHRHAGTGNIGESERRRREYLGVGGLVTAFGLAVYLIAAETGMWWRLLTFPPFWAGTLGLMQSREKVCVLLAMRGTRILGDCGTEEPVEDPEYRKMLRRRGLKLAARAAGLAAVLTLGVLAFPV